MIEDNDAVVMAVDIALHSKDLQQQYDDAVRDAQRHPEDEEMKIIKNIYEAIWKDFTDRFEYVLWPKKYKEDYR